MIKYIQRFLSKCMFGVNRMGFRVMPIYPNAFETKAAVFEDEREIYRASAKPDQIDILMARTPEEEFSIRFGPLEKTMNVWLPEIDRVDAVIGLAVIPGIERTGVYLLDDEFLKRAKFASRAGRVINQGVIMASRFASLLSSKIFAMVPFLISEVDVLRRISGAPGLIFGRMTHTVPIKNALRVAADELGKSPREVSLVIAYLGENFSICAHSEGRVRDFTNAFERGPYSPWRSGGVPAAAIVRMAYSGMWSKIDLIRMATFNSGVKGYTGTGDVDEIISRAESGNARSSLVLNAMVYQIASEIAAQAAVLRGEVDAIVITGDLAENNYLVNAIAERVSWITKRIITFRGEDELLTMTRAALRALKGEEALRLA